MSAILTMIVVRLTYVARIEMNVLQGLVQIQVLGYPRGCISFWSFFLSRLQPSSLPSCAGLVKEKHGLRVAVTLEGTSVMGGVMVGEGVMMGEGVMVGEGVMDVEN